MRVKRIDPSTEQGAQDLARRIHLHWKREGVECVTRVEPGPFRDGKRIYEVRSTFPNGMKKSK